MTTQERKNEIFTAIKNSFPSSHIREYEFGFRVFLVPREYCVCKIQENSPVEFSVTYVDDSDKLKIQTSLIVKPDNKRFYCDNAAKKHRLNLTIKENKPFSSYLDKLKKVLQEEGKNILHNDNFELQTFFI